MKNEKCLDCIEYKRCKDSCTSWIFFMVGLIATISVRAVTVLMSVNPIYGKVAWYVGIGGFLLFFLYKFRVNVQRSKLIRQQSLVAKINQGEQLANEDYALIGAILCGLSSRKESINYIFIFALSVIALILAAYMDFLN